MYNQPYLESGVAIAAFDVKEERIDWNWHYCSDDHQPT